MKVIVGRRETENGHLKYFHELPESNSSALLEPDDFRGPVALIVGPVTDGALKFACGLLLRYAKRVPSDGCRVRVQQGDATSTLDAQPHADAKRAETLATR